MATKVLVEYSARLQQAVDQTLGAPAHRVLPEPHGRRRNSLTDTMQAAGGGIALGVLTSGPSNGYGPAVWRAITVNADGTWTATGSAIAVVVPLLK